MRQLKAIHNLFRFKDDLFRNKAEIIRNGACTGIKRNKELKIGRGHSSGEVFLLCNLDQLDIRSVQQDLYY